MNKTKQVLKQYDSLQNDNSEEKPLLKNDLIKALLVSTLESILEQSTSINKENDEIRINNLLRNINIIHALKDFLYVGRETVLANELDLLSNIIDKEIFIDIGANIGNHTLYFRNSFKKC